MAGGFRPAGHALPTRLLALARMALDKSPLSFAGHRPEVETVRLCLLPGGLGRVGTKHPAASPIDRAVRGWRDHDFSYRRCYGRCYRSDFLLAQCLECGSIDLARAAGTGQFHSRERPHASQPAPRPVRRTGATVTMAWHLMPFLLWERTAA